MSRRASKSSIVGDSGEFYMECKAAYLSVFDSIKDEIQSQDDLVQVLQQAGRNPSRKMLSKYWTSSTDQMTFDDFVDICKKEKPTSADDLMKAFRKIDVNGDGYISLDELYKIMTTKGEKMSRSDVKKMIDDVDENKDGRLDYGEFCTMIMKTTEECKKVSRKMMEKKEKQRRKEDLTKTSESKMGSQLSVKSSASVRSHHSERPMSASMRSNKNEENVSMEVTERTSTKEEKEPQSYRRSSSKASLKSTDDNCTKQEVMGSHTSLNTANNKKLTGSKVSIKSKEESDLKNSKVSLKSNEETISKQNGGSQVSLRLTEEKKSKKQNMGSKSSLKSIEDVSKQMASSKVSLRSKQSMMSTKEGDDLEGETVRPDSSRSQLHDGKDSDEEAPQQSVKPVPKLRKDNKKQLSEGGMFGSFASVKSGGSILSGSKRSLLSVDDLPKPSPRSKKSKGQAPASLPKLIEPKNLKEWTHCNSKGMFFIDEDTGGIISHQYELTLTEETSIWITIKPLSNRSLANKNGLTDTAVYLLREKPYDDGTHLVSFSQHCDSKGCYGMKCSLDAGTYHIIPFTTGTRLKKREDEPYSSKTLLQEKDGKYTISKAFRKALEDIFDLCDLDGNGTMSRDEFNWYNIRTSDEEVGDDEWEVVEEKIELNNGEITKNGFFDLNILEAEDSNGDEDDMWVTVNSMGFNKELVIDEGCPFLLDVYTEDCDDVEVKVIAIGNMMEKLQRPLCQSVMEKGTGTKVKGMKDLMMYTYIGDARATIVLDNKSYSTVRLKLDCSNSQNMITNQESMEESFTVKLQSQIIAYHFTPEDEDSDWNVNCSEIIQK